MERQLWSLGLPARLYRVEGVKQSRCLIAAEDTVVQPGVAECTTWVQPLH
jgi:hypothetical protein